MRTLSLVLTFVLVVAPVSAQQRGMQPADYYRMTFIGGVEMAPTAEHVAFTVTTVDEAANTRRNTVWLQRLRNGQPQGEAFRVTDPTHNTTVSGWSPDGQLLVLNSRRGPNPNTVWLLRVGGVGGEAYQIDGIDSAPVYSPDGQWIAMVRGPDEERTAAVRARNNVAPDALTNTLNAERFDGLVITHLRYKRDGTHPLLPHPSFSPKRQLWVVPAAGGTPRQITDLPYSVSGVTWTPDSRSLLFVVDEAEDDERNWDPTTRIYAVSRDGGNARPISPADGGYRAPAFSRDGRTLAFLHTHERNAKSNLMTVALGADLSFSGQPRNLTASWDHVPGAPWFTADGRALRWSMGAFGNTHVWEVPVAGGTPRQVTQGDRQLGSISLARDGAWMAYTSTDPTRPDEVFVADANGGREQRLTSFNDGWLATVQMQPAERITWTVADGTEIEGWVIKPIDFDPTRRYPMVLKAHGGPAGMYGNTFFQTFHVLSANGMFVLYPNPRGSTGYGHSFTQGVTVGQWGLVDEEDFMKGIDATLAKYPQIDAARIGVSGGSYGGYVTNWLTARMGDRFAAAVTSRSITNLEMLWGTTDSQGWDSFGHIWDNRDAFRAASPLSYVENVKAPTLIIHSEYDHRTPMQDAEIWFTSLKKLGVPVEFVRYPRSSHGLSRSGEPWLLVDRLERIRSWFDYWLVQQPPRRTAGGEVSGH
jgi:dipeptidyl aminopeptidase/acylaminoacyl peptidase